LAATISVQSILTHDRLDALFKQFDIDNKNEITSENIKDAMAKLGKVVSDEEMEEIMRKHDVSGDKAISFDEFK
jgi:Ca2+-binding EF-hand superfamily protein